MVVAMGVVHRVSSVLVYVVAAVLASNSAGVAAVAAVCATKACPSGFQTISSVSSGCFYCLRPYSPNCGPFAAPVLCGGITGMSCPTITCAYSSTTTISGPGSCATAKAQIGALALGQTSAAFNITPIVINAMADFCDTSQHQPFTTYIEKSASVAANAVAQAVAKSLYHFNTYTCSCVTGGGNSAAFAVVKAKLQAVAQAIAFAFANAAVQLTANGDYTQCYPMQWPVEANGNADALALSVNTALLKVYNSSLSVGGSCSGAVSMTKMTSAVASAVACTFADAFASAVYKQYTDGDGAVQVVSGLEPTGVTYACSSSYSMSYSVPVADAPPIVCSAPEDMECPCTPLSYTYTNLGFEEGTFDEGTPTWTVVSTQNDAETTPSIVTHADFNFEDGSSDTLRPYNGTKYFAAIPAGCAVNTISTTITVPPCAKAISAAVVFKCNEGRDNDAGSINITATNLVTGESIFLVREFDCATVGNTGEDGERGLGGASGDPEDNYWTVLHLAVPFGVYSVDVSAISTNVLDCDSSNGFSSIFYVDEVSFS